MHDKTTAHPTCPNCSAPLLEDKHESGYICQYCWEKPRTVDVERASGMMQFVRQLHRYVMTDNTESWSSALVSAETKYLDDYPISFYRKLLKRGDAQQAYHDFLRSPVPMEISSEVRELLAEGAIHSQTVEDAKPVEDFVNGLFSDDGKRGKWLEKSRERAQTVALEAERKARENAAPMPGKQARRKRRPFVVGALLTSVLLILLAAFSLSLEQASARLAGERYGKAVALQDSFLYADALSLYRPLVEESYMDTVQRADACAFGLLAQSSDAAEMAKMLSSAPLEQLTCLVDEGYRLLTSDTPEGTSYETAIALLSTLKPYAAERAEDHNAAQKALLLAHQEEAYADAAYVTFADMQGDGYDDLVMLYQETPRVITISEEGIVPMDMTGDAAGNASALLADAVLTDPAETDATQLLSRHALAYALDPTPARMETACQQAIEMAQGMKATDGIALLASFMEAYPETALASSGCAKDITQAMGSLCLDEALTLARDKDAACIDFLEQASGYDVEITPAAAQAAECFSVGAERFDLLEMAYRERFAYADTQGMDDLAAQMSTDFEALIALPDGDLAQQDILALGERISALGARLPDGYAENPAGYTAKSLKENEEVLRQAKQHVWIGTYGAIAIDYDDAMDYYALNEKGVLVLAERVIRDAEGEARLIALPDGQSVLVETENEKKQVVAISIYSISGNQLVTRHEAERLSAYVRTESALTYAVPLSGGEVGMQKVTLSLLDPEDVSVEIITSESSKATPLPPEAAVVETQRAAEPSPPYAMEEREPNGTAANAMTLPADQVVRARLNEDDDVDCFRIVLPERSEIAIDFVFDGNGANVRAYCMEVVDTRSDRVIISGYAMGDYKEVPIRYLYLEAGEYIVRVTSDAHWVSAPYEMVWTVVQTGTGVEAEWNGSPQDATALLPGTDMTGILLTPDDEDYFQLDLPSDGRLDIRFHTDQEVMQRENGQSLIFHVALAGDENAAWLDWEGTARAIPDTEAGSEQMMLSFVVPAGRYMLRTKAETWARAPYTISTRFTEVGEGGVPARVEREPNNTLQTAEATRAGDSIGAALTGVADRDCYGYTVSSGEQVTLTISFEEKYKGSRFRYTIYENGRKLVQAKDTYDIEEGAMRFPISLPQREVDMHFVVEFSCPGAAEPIYYTLDVFAEGV